MQLLLACVALLALLLAIGYWWRHYSLACPAGLSWLVENPFMQALAGPELLFQRMGLAPGMCLLDVGAGPGRIAIPAARRVGGSGEVVALDIQHKMLTKLEQKAAQASITNLRTLHAGAGDGAVQRDHFDRAVMVTVLGEIRDRPAAVAEIFAALKPGGLLSITELIPDPHYQSRSRVSALCSVAGFVEADYFGNPLVFTLNFRKPS